MSDYLERMAGRTLGLISVVQPLVASRFAPPAVTPLEEGIGGEEIEQEVPRPAPPQHQNRVEFIGQTSVSEVAPVAARMTDPAPLFHQREIVRHEMTPETREPSPLTEPPVPRPNVKPGTAPQGTPGRESRGAEVRTIQTVTRQRQNTIPFSERNSQQGSPATSHNLQDLQEPFRRELVPDEGPGTEDDRPVVRVNIGQIEVRAIQPEKPVPKTPPGLAKPKLSLDAYLGSFSKERQ